MDLNIGSRLDAHAVWSMDTAPRDRGALLTALTTEHFALQGARSATITESLGRSTIYLGSLSREPRRVRAYRTGREHRCRLPLLCSPHPAGTLLPGHRDLRAHR